MRDLIISFLDKHYTISENPAYTLWDKVLSKDVMLDEVLSSVTLIFGTDNHKTHDILMNWFGNKMIQFNNRLVDIQENIYLKTGQTLKFYMPTPNIDVSY